MEYIAGGATQNSIRVAQWMLQVCGRGGGGGARATGVLRAVASLGRVPAASDTAYLCHACGILPTHRNLLHISLHPPAWAPGCPKCYVPTLTLVLSRLACLFGPGAAGAGRHHLLWLRGQGPLR